MARKGILYAKTSYRYQRVCWTSKKNCIYVDKTKHIYSLLKENCRTFLSRPRRFGKSLLLSTLEAALQGKRELFDGLWITSSDYSWTPYGVIKLDFSEFSIESLEDFKQSLVIALQTIADQYDLPLQDNLSANDTLKILITSLCSKKRERPFTSVAILIDEYDHPILHTLHKSELAMDIRNMMKNFSCVIKAQAKLVQFVFITGVSAFSKSGLSSGLNNLDNLTMNKQFFDICGYTEEEVDLYFKDHMQHFADQNGTSYEEIRRQLKTWYNGYSFIENSRSSKPG